MRHLEARLWLDSVKLTKLEFRLLNEQTLLQSPHLLCFDFFGRAKQPALEAFE